MKRLLTVAIIAGFALFGSGAANAEDKNPVVVMETSHGTIKIELFPDKAPITVKNFLDYVDDKFYDGTVYHRVIANFMIQGGGFTPGMKEKEPRKSIKNEASNGLSNERGTIAMARLGRRDETPEETEKAANSATAQFFINVKDNIFLDKAKAEDGTGYCVFGKVVDGLDVVDKIKAVKTGRTGATKDVPVEDVVIKSVRRAK